MINNFVKMYVNVQVTGRWMHLLRIQLKVREKWETEEYCLALSGGVDSSSGSRPSSKAIGKQLMCL